MSEIKRYVSEHSALMEEWDWEKNAEIGLDPSRVTYGSTKSAFWKCKEKHSYIARIDHRCISGSGCPYCAGLKAIVGINDLATLYPELLIEWDNIKNGKKNPQDYKPGSNTKVWWKCNACGYNWQTQISQRALKNTGCPICAKTKRGRRKVENLVLKNGSLQDIRPDLVQEWDFIHNESLLPNEITVGSNKAVWWKCSVCGYSWKKSIASRNKGSGCPVCKGKQVLFGYNDLATKYPQIAREWHPTKNGNLTPQMVTPGAELKVWWKCHECGYEWNSILYSRTKKGTGSGCPFCAGKVVLCGRNDLATTHPHLTVQWNYNKNGTLTPKEFSAGSNKHIWWKCSEGHEWKASICARTRGRNCPECAKINRPYSLHETYLNTNGSLQNNRPEIAKEWHPYLNGSLEPDMVTEATHKKVWWQCTKGHSWQTSVYSRTKGNGCPFCTNELSTSFPEQAIYYYLSKVTVAVNRYKLNGKEIDIFLPNLQIGIEYNGRFYHKNRKAKDDEKVCFFRNHGINIIRIEESDNDYVEKNIIYYRYTNQHYLNLSWVIDHLLSILELPSLDVNIQRDTMSIYENYLLIEKENSIGKRYPWLIEEWNYSRNGQLSPWQVSYGSQKKVWWKCKKCGYEWESAAYTRKKSGCPLCAGRVILEGINDLATRNTQVASEWDYSKNDLTPNQVSANSHKYAWWNCQFGHSWYAQIKCRNQGSGCPHCYKKSKIEKPYG